MNFCRHLLNDARAASSVEYAIILAMIFVAAVSAMGGVGTATIGMWSDVSDKVAASGSETTEVE